MAGCTSVFNARLSSFLPSYWCVALLYSFAEADPEGGEEGSSSGQI